MHMTEYKEVRSPLIRQTFIFLEHPTKSNWTKEMNCMEYFDGSMA